MEEGTVTPEALSSAGEGHGDGGGGGVKGKTLARKTLKERIEELWEAACREPGTPEQEQEYLNWAFNRIPVSLFPPMPTTKVIEIQSDANIAEAVHILSKHNILSAPVSDVTATGNVSWMDKYMGMVDFSSVVMWVLNQASEKRAEIELDENSPKEDGDRAALAENGAGLVASSGDGSATRTSGKDFYEALKENEEFKNTKVSSIAGCFRWAPFLPVEPSDTLLTLLLLLSKYHIKSIPVVEPGDSTIYNFITQSSVGTVLSECSGLDWFDRVADRPLVDHGLPMKTADQLFKIDADEPVLGAFQLMEEHQIGGIPVVEGEGGKKIIGNVSARDIRFLLMEPGILHKQRDLTVRQLMEKVKRLYSKNNLLEATSRVIMSPPVTCGKNETLKNAISILANYHIHRVYVIDDDDETLLGVVTIRDIISRFVTEPENYFGNFFTRVLPVSAVSYGGE